MREGAEKEGAERDGAGRDGAERDGAERVRAKNDGAAIEVDRDARGCLPPSAPSARDAATGAPETPSMPPHEVVQDTVARALSDLREGEPEAAQRFWPLVYEELHRIASRALSREQPDEILQTTAVVNEAYLRLGRVARAPWHGRVHFFAMAARVIRQILVDWARSQKSAKRGRERNRIELLDDLLVAQPQPVDLLDLEAKLEELGREAPRIARVVELRFFAGLTIPEVAEVLGVSDRTVDIDWDFARCWLRRELRRGLTQ
ncbi:MAG: ECF-type sigma factor [Planctomycetota bacterium]